MAAEREEGPHRRWCFTREQLANSPSRADGVDPEKELRYRQDAASLIQDMGPKLNLNVLCMSTAIVYMHRFYMINSFKAFDRVTLATAALFLAAKVEEHPRKLEHVAKCSYSLLNKDKPDKHDLDVQSEVYAKLIDDITYHELILLQTLGFDVQVKHPHPHVVQCMNLVGVSRDLSQAAFFLAHNSQLLTTFCLEHSPTVVACMCIHLTCAWKGLEIPRSSDDKNWWEYVDKSVTYDKLEGLATEFLNIVDKSPSRLKKRIQDNIRMAVEGARPHTSSSQGSSSRHPPAPATPISLNYKPKDRQTQSHSTARKHPPPTSSANKPHPTPTQSAKLQRSSPPPPPPPIPPTQNDRLPPDPQKIRKHKESYHHHHHHHSSQNNSKSSQHHGVPADPSGTAALPLSSSSFGNHHHHHRQQQPAAVKHPLSHKDQSLHHPKSKKLKTDDSASAHKQPLSLTDYRQSKRHHYHQQPMPSDVDSSNKSMKTHHSITNHSFPPGKLAPLGGGINKYHPPLPPPLPLNEAPPPPPPPV